MATIYQFPSREPVAMLPSERRGWVALADTVQPRAVAETVRRLEAAEWPNLTRARDLRNQARWEAEFEADISDLMESCGFARHDAQEITFDVHQKPAGCRCDDTAACRFVPDGRCPMLGREGEQ